MYVHHTLVERLFNDENVPFLLYFRAQVPWVGRLLSTSYSLAVRRVLTSVSHILSIEKKLHGNQIVSRRSLGECSPKYHSKWFPLPFSTASEQAEADVGEWEGMRFCEQFWQLVILCVLEGSPCSHLDVTISSLSRSVDGAFLLFRPLSLCCFIMAALIH